jgi:hypothetical protein
VTFETRGGVLFGGVMVMEWRQNGIARQDDVGGWSSFGADLLGAISQEGDLTARCRQIRALYEWRVIRPERWNPPLTPFSGAWPRGRAGR